MIATSCEIDNFKGPDAKFYGIIKDTIGGLPVETDLINGSVIRAYELGYPTQVAQTWVIKNNGEYRNDLVFSGEYDLEFANGNFFPFKIKNFKIKPGENRYDFTVIPYIRIKNCNIIHDKANNKIVATFNLEPGNPSVKLKAIRLYAFTDIYVGEAVKFNTTGSGFSQSFSPSKTIDGATYTLSIDLNSNANLFKYNRNYYFRVGALADIAGVGTIRYNYAPNVKIAL